MAQSAVVTPLVVLKQRYDKETLKKYIFSLRGKENITATNVPEVIRYLGEDWDHLAIEIYKLFGKKEAPILIGILLEFYVKFGVLINSMTLGRYWRENRLTFLKWNATKGLASKYSGIQDLSSGTSETSEIDVLVALENSRALLALSGKAEGVDISQVGTTVLNQEVAWAQLQLKSMQTLHRLKKYEGQRNIYSAIVVNKSQLTKNGIPEYVRANRGQDYLVDSMALRGVVQETFKYVVSNNLLDNHSLDNETIPKNHIELWWHQEEFKKACLEYYLNGGSKFLAFHLPRSGKTVSGLEIAVETDSKLVLLLSGYPSVNDQWKVDTIAKFSKYAKYEVVNLSNKEKLPEKFEPGKYYFVMVSLQDLKMKSKKEREKFKRKHKLIFSTEFDLMIQDEIQQGFETPKTRKLLKQITSKKTLALSATAEKNLWLGSFNKDNTHYWDLNDEKTLLENPAIPESYKSPYRDMPQIRMLRIKPDMSLFDSYKDFYTPQEGFSFRKLFRLNKDGNFVNKESIRQLFNFILNNQAEMSQQFAKKGNKSSEAKDTVRNNPMSKIIEQLGEHPQVSLFFVPDTKIQKKLQELLEEDFAEYLAKHEVDVKITNSKLNTGSELTSFVKGIDENSARKYFLILVDQLGVGTTIRRCSAVFFLEDGNSLTAYWQRAMRNRTYDFSGKKPYAFVVDLNPTRAFAMEYRRIQAKGYKGIELRQKLKEYYATVPVFDQNKWLNTVDAEEAVQRALELTYQWVTQFENLSGGFNVYRLAKDEMGKVAQKELLSLEIPGLKIINKLDIKMGEMEKGKISSSFSDSEHSSNKEESNDEDIAWEKLAYLVDCLPTMLLCGLIKKVKINTLEELAEFFNQKDEEGFSHRKLFNEILTGNADNKVLTPNQYKELLKRNLELTILGATIHQFHEEFPGVDKFDFSKIQSEQLKKSVAEVITPKEIVLEQLSQIPDAVWKDKNQVIVDLSMGTGTYLLEAKNRLMISLAQEIPDQQSREKHILENMLVGQDILFKNSLITQSRLNPRGYKFKTFVGDSLSAEGFISKLKPTVFIGNLPFQKNTDDGKRSAQNHNSWSEFLEMYIRLCPEEGYISVICPISWMSPSGKNRDTLLTDFNITSLQVGTTIFGERIGWIVAKKTIVDKQMTKTVSCIDGVIHNHSVDLTSLKLIPNTFSVEVSSICEKFWGIEDRFSFKGDSELHSSTYKECLVKEKTEGFDFKVKHTSSYEVFSSKKHSLHSKKKVLVTKSGYPIAFCDSKGEWSFTEATMYSLVDTAKEGFNKEKLINSKLFQFVLSLYKWGAGYNHIKVFENLPYVELEEYSDEAVFKAFGLTEAEIQFIVQKK